MKLRGIHYFVFLAVFLAIVAIPWHDWDAFIRLPALHLAGFAFLVVLGLITESLALTITVGRSAGNSSVAFLPLLTSVLLFGSASGVVFLSITGLIAEFLIRKKEAIRGVFNIAQYIISTTAGGIAFVMTGGVPLALLVEVSPDPSIVQQLLPFAAFCVAFLGTNISAVSMAMALSQRDMPFRRVWIICAGRSGTNAIADLLICPFGLIAAFIYLELGIVGIAVTIFPLLFIRYSYVSNHRLQQTNKDLLYVLIKAIETRDPYTSGHSLRVSTLANKIAALMNLPERTINSVTTAALLHDIGKIDIIYEEILQKPAGLSDQERDIIESHVTKGVELLTSLSSFEKAVLDAVRHHHELFDGSGYPDGLSGIAIPVGARIIKICDAVDAMLSDRPYRNALDLSEVRLQLTSCSGSQFDPEIVARVLQGSLLSEHAVDLREDIQRDKKSKSQVSPRARAVAGS